MESGGVDISSLSLIGCITLGKLLLTLFDLDLPIENCAILTEGS